MPNDAPDPALELILVRHAETVANVEGRWTGWGETALTELGRAQVEAVANRLANETGQIDAVYTSPLTRALETAAGIGRALGIDPLPVDGLREINFGALDGVRLSEMEVDYPELYRRWQNKADADFAWPEGERRADFFHRVAATCADLVARHRTGRIVVVAHGGTLRSCLSFLLPEQLGAWWAYPLENCGITRVRVEENGVRLVVLNDTAHLLNGEHGEA